jgi:hypothetical protein
MDINKKFNVFAATTAFIAMIAIVFVVFYLVLFAPI